LDGSINKIGKDKEHVKLSVKQKSTISFSAIGFWLSEKFDKIINQSSFSMAYTVDQNTWRGKTSVQLKIKDIK
jgi:single-stranded-DNA-specific exonuclease